MRTSIIGWHLATATCLTVSVLSPTAIVDAKQVATIEGSWKGGFIGSDFTFEFSRSGDRWAGRYWSKKSGKWADLQNVEVKGDTVRFSFTSQPPSSFELTIAADGKSLSGSATFGQHPALPMTLIRAS